MGRASGPLRLSSSQEELLPYHMVTGAHPLWESVRETVRSTVAGFESRSPPPVSRLVFGAQRVATWGAVACPGAAHTEAMERQNSQLVRARLLLSLIAACTSTVLIDAARVPQSGSSRSAVAPGLCLQRSEGVLEHGCKDVACPKCDDAQLHSCRARGILCEGVVESSARNAVLILRGGFDNGKLAAWLKVLRRILFPGNPPRERKAVVPPADNTKAGSSGAAKSSKAKGKVGSVIAIRSKARNAMQSGRMRVFL
eukprot:2741233-Pleurochrysis_carterae.AAC.3